MGTTVLHKHRVGDAAPVDRVSELAFLRGQPKAILEWIDIGGVRTPICADLDPARLELPEPHCPRRFSYGGTTFDPRIDRRHVSRVR